MTEEELEKIKKEVSEDHTNDDFYYDNMAYAIEDIKFYKELALKLIEELKLKL